jgi:hypothetical protein
MRSNTPIIIDNSPLEFVLMGPNGETDSILVKSSNAGIDLLGLASYEYLVPKDFATNSPTPLTFFAKFRSINIVEVEDNVNVSMANDTTSTDFHPRRFAYRLIWVGQCTPYYKEKIVSLLYNNLRDLKLAFLQDEKLELEMFLGLIILHCSVYDQRIAKRQKVYFTVIIIYILALIIMGVYLLLRLNSKSIQ